MQRRRQPADAHVNCSASFRHANERIALPIDSIARVQLIQYPKQVAIFGQEDVRTRDPLDRPLRRQPNSLLVQTASKKLQRPLRAGRFPAKHMRKKFPRCRRRRSQHLYRMNVLACSPAIRTADCAGARVQLRSSPVAPKREPYAHRATTRCTTYVHEHTTWAPPATSARAACLRDP